MRHYFGVFLANTVAKIWDGSCFTGEFPTSDTLFKIRSKLSVSLNIMLKRAVTSSIRISRHSASYSVVLGSISAQVERNLNENFRVFRIPVTPCQNCRPISISPRPLHIAFNPSSSNHSYHWTTQVKMWTAGRIISIITLASAASRLYSMAYGILITIMYCMSMQPF